MSGPHGTLAERFWPKVDLSDLRGCWPWLGYCDRLGYGWIEKAPLVGSGRAGTAKAARVAWEIWNQRKVPEGLVIDHLCRRPVCVNPHHLEAVSQHLNVLRGNGGKHWAAKTACPAGHPYDQANTYVNTTRDGNKHRECRACGRSPRRRAFHRERQRLKRRAAGIPERNFSCKA